MRGRVNIWIDGWVCERTNEVLSIKLDQYLQHDEGWFMKGKKERRDRMVIFRVQKCTLPKGNS